MLHFMCCIVRGGKQFCLLYDSTANKLKKVQIAEVIDRLHQGELIRNVSVINNTLVGFSEEKDDIPLYSILVDDELGKAFVGVIKTGIDEYTVLPKSIADVNFSDRDAIHLSKIGTAISPPDRAGNVKIARITGSMGTIRNLYTDCIITNRVRKSHGTQPWDSKENNNPKYENINTKLSMFGMGYAIDDRGTLRAESEDAVMVTIFKVPEGCTRILKNTFCDNEILRQVILPDSLKIIGPNAFYKCRNLELIQFGAGLQEICSRAFYGCGYIKSIKLPYGIKNINSEAFGCAQIGEIYLPDSLRGLAYDTFKKGNPNMLIETSRRIAEALRSGKWGINVNNIIVVE